MISLFARPDFLFWVGGIAIPFVLAGLWKYLIKPRWDHRRKNRDLITGEWHCYFYSNHNKTRQLQFVEARLIITPGLFRKHAVVEKRETDKTISYKGDVENEGYCLLIKMRSANNDEFVHFRLYQPLRTDETVIYGLQLSSDVHRRPYSGALLISENKLTEDQVKIYLKNNYFYSEKERMLTTIADE